MKAVFDDADLQGATFSGADLRNADFQNARLERTSFDRCNLLGAELHGTFLVDAAFDGAVWGLDTTWPGAAPDEAIFVGPEAELEGVDLSGFDLSDIDLSFARLAGANLLDTNLSGANLEGACLRAQDLSSLSIVGARIDAGTYRASGWGPEDLATLKRRGAKVVNLHQFPIDARLAVLGKEASLLLGFDVRVQRFDNVAIELLILQLLGPDAHIRVAEVVEPEGEETLGLVRVAGSSPVELTRFAEGFYDKVWRQTMVKLNEAASLGHILKRLEELREALTSAQLLNPLVGEMLEDKAQEHQLRKDQRIAETTMQRIARGLGRKAVKEVVGDDLGEIALGELSKKR